MQWKAKKSLLYKIKPGSITDSEPKILWIKMVNHLNGFDRALVLRRKFNNELESALSPRKSHYLIDLHLVVNDTVYFSRANVINEDGMAANW